MQETGPARFQSTGEFRMTARALYCTVYPTHVERGALCLLPLASSRTGDRRVNNKRHVLSDTHPTWARGRAPYYPRGRDRAPAHTEGLLHSARNELASSHRSRTHAHTRARAARARAHTHTHTPRIVYHTALHSLRDPIMCSPLSIARPAQFLLALFRRYVAAQSRHWCSESSVGRKPAASVLAT